MAVEASVSASAGTSGIPLQHKKALVLANLSSEFAKLAREGCASDAAPSILEGHIKAMWSELDELKKKKKKGKKSNVAPNNAEMSSTAEVPSGSFEKHTYFVF